MTTRVRLGSSSLEVSRIVLGGNVFGWTADRGASYEILDSYVARGGNSIDIADAYPYWAPGCSGGESEAIVGDWMRARGNRADVVIATKVGRFPDNHGLTRAQITAGLQGSLKRLGTDYIDLYYCHSDDLDTPLEETLTTLTEYVDAGVIRAIAASNYSVTRLAEALAISDAQGLARFCALQPHYSLMVRHEYEGAMLDLCAREGLACLPYFPLAAGFLTGKYRTADVGNSARAAHVTRHLTDRGWRVLAALDAVAARQDSSPTTVALAWLVAQPTVAAPIVSVSREDQLTAVMESIDLRLTTRDCEELATASDPDTPIP